MLCRRIQYRKCAQRGHSHRDGGDRPNGRTLYVAALGSSKVAIYDTGELEQDTFVPNLAIRSRYRAAAPRVSSSTKRGTSFTC